MGQSREQLNAYMRKYLKRRYDERRAEGKALLGGKCAECGSIERLEFDHLNPKTKALDLATQVRTCTREVFLKEVLKCQLLCKGCHKKRSDHQSSVEHGGGQSGKKNCPCVPCKERKRQYMHLWKKVRNLLRQ